MFSILIKIMKNEKKHICINCIQLRVIVPGDMRKHNQKYYILSCFSLIAETKQKLVNRIVKTVIHFQLEHCPNWVQLTMTWGAAVRTPIVARIVNKLKVIRHMRSSTIAANFQSFSTEAAWSSFRILLLITWISASILTSSRWIPERAKCSNVGGVAADVLEYHV